MKRAACLLLLLSVWLLAFPARSLPSAPARLPTASAASDRASLAVAHVVPDFKPPQVLRAPLWARLPAAPLPVLGRRGCRFGRVVSRAPDLRAALRRVQVRRRVPRLGSEPPWS